jgi:hypothetical protein
MFLLWITAMNDEVRTWKVKNDPQIKTVSFAWLSNEGQEPLRTKRKGIADAWIENTLIRRTQAEQKQC